MERPVWFKCEKCLLWEIASKEIKTDRGWCSCSSTPKVIKNELNSVYRTQFCEKWICKNCWETWDTVDFTNNSPVFINHSTCKEVVFT